MILAELTIQVMIENELSESEILYIIYTLPNYVP